MRNINLIDRAVTMNDIMAFAAAALTRPRRSKHNQPGNAATGPVAAAERSARYRASAGSASTLKKAMRVQRIRNGDRPARYATESAFV